MRGKTGLRDAARTRNELLRAAQQLFSEQGYQATGVRQVAAKAGVSWALVGRYFGSKERLLRACLEDLLDIAPLLEGERSEFGNRMAQVFYENEQGGGPLSMMLMAMADPTARELCQSMFRSNILEPLSEWLGEPVGHARAARLNVLWSGVLALRQLHPSAGEPPELAAAQREWLREMTQAIVDNRTPVHDG
jgi:AcrR family transcriptional regulator